MTKPNCTDCDLHRYRKQIVEGKGINRPRYLFVGEAPGREENAELNPEKKGPFIGGAGRVLTSLCFSAGINRFTEGYVTNVCRCWPKDNRTPTLNEIMTCLPNLYEEIERIQPEKIICLGAVAAAALTGKDLTWRGMIVKDNVLGIPTLITYHPSFLFRKRDMYPIVAWDLMKLKDFTLEDFNEPPVDYAMNPSFDAAKLTFETWLQNNTPVACDIETTSPQGHHRDAALDPFEGEWIGISFSGSPNQAMQFGGAALLQYKSLILRFLTEHKAQIWQNNLFDRYFLAIKEKLKTPTILHDTQTGMHILHSGLPKKLDMLRSLYTNKEPYKTDANYQTNIAWLNCRDTDVTREVWQGQMKALKPKKALLDHMMHMDDIALHMKVKGVLVDQERLAMHYMDLKPQVEEMYDTFYQKYKVELSSPTQLSKLLYDEFKFPKPPRAVSATATDEKCITYLLGKTDDPGDRAVLEAITNYRGKAKTVSTYCEGIFKRIKPDGMLHPGWKTVGTESQTGNVRSAPDTGRWSCENPSLMNVPEHMRDIIIPENNGWFLGGDYDRIELWVMAIEAEDLELLAILERGDDVHAMALEAIEEEYPLTAKIGATQARLRAKALVFGTPYGRTPQSIAQEFNVAVSIAEKWQASFYGRFPGLKKYFEETIPKFFDKHGYWETRFGRCKYTTQLPEVKNHAIQSTAADIFQRGGIKLWNAGFDPRIAVHDQWINWEPAQTDFKLKLFIQCMETAVPEMHYRFPVSAAWGKNWKEAK